MGEPVNILAIETATEACALGVRTNANSEITRVVGGDRRHTEALALEMRRALAELGLRPRDVERVVVDRGPGLFTGLRVGIATAIAFAQGIGVDVVTVTSLELLAYGARDLGASGRLVSCVDGRRGEIFAQGFTLGGVVVALDEPRVTTAREVAIIWATNGAPVTFTGDGVERYRDDIAAVPNGSIVEQRVPSVHAALDIAVHRAPDRVVSPLYLREADAVANFATRQRP